MADPASMLNVVPLPGSITDETYFLFLKHSFELLTSYSRCYYCKKDTIANTTLPMPMRMTKPAPNLTHMLSILYTIAAS